MLHLLISELDFKVPSEPSDLKVLTPAYDSDSATENSRLGLQYGRTSPVYAESEAVGDLSRIYTISYLNADPAQGYLRRPIEPNPPKSPQFSRPMSTSTLRDRSRSSSRSQYHYRERSAPRSTGGGMYSILSSMRSPSSTRPKSPSMLNEEAIRLSHYPAAQRPDPNDVAKIERDDFPAPPFPYTADRASSRSGREGTSTKKRLESPSRERTHQGKGLQQLEVPQTASSRASRPRSREVPIMREDDININEEDLGDEDEESSGADEDPQTRKEEKELAKIASGIGKIFLQKLREREKIKAWKKSNLDPRSASRTPSATREVPNRPLRYENPRNASPSRDLHRPRPWNEDDTGEHSPTRSSRARSQMSAAASSAYGYKVVPSVRSTPRPGYGVSAPTGGGFVDDGASPHHLTSSYLNGTGHRSATDLQTAGGARSSSHFGTKSPTHLGSEFGRLKSPGNAHLRRSMPNVNQMQKHLIHSQPPKLYPYHLLVTSNYRLPPEVDRCHLERHLSAEEFQYIFHCDRLDFYRLPEWRRNELKRRARLF